MKKLLTVILAAALVLGALCITSGAGADSKQIFNKIDGMMRGYVLYAEVCNGYFSEGGSPSVEAIYQSLKSKTKSQFADYIVKGAGTSFVTYHIPAEEYENELVFKMFAKSDAILETLHSSDLYKTDKDEPYYEIVLGGGFGNYLPTVVPVGYTERDDGALSVYARYAYVFVDMYDEEEDEWYQIEYAPSKDEIEGVDYTYICRNVFTYDKDRQEYVLGIEFVPAKYIGAVNAVLDLKGGIYYSYEPIEPEEIPEAEDMITPANSKKTADFGNVLMDIDRDTFGADAKVYCFEYYREFESDAPVFSETEELLKEYGEVCNIFDVDAKKGSTAVQPKEKVSMSVQLPYDFSPDSSFYYIAEDGTVTEVETEIETDIFDPTVLYVTAEPEHFSRYAVAGFRYGDADENGKVNLADVSAMLKKITKWDVTVNEITTDTNRDGKVTLSDVSLVLKYIAKWDIAFGGAYKSVDPANH